MELPERMSRNDTIKMLERKRDDFRDEYNGILAGVISGDENWVGDRIYQLDEQIEKLRAVKV